MRLVIAGTAQPTPGAFDVGDAVARALYRRSSGRSNGLSITLCRLCQQGAQVSELAAVAPQISRSISAG